MEPKWHPRDRQPFGEREPGGRRRGCRRSVFFGRTHALTVENGRPLWSDNFSNTRSVNAVSSLADIRGRPVLDRGRVFAASHSGRIAAIDLRSGERAWEKDFGSTHTPWVAGDYVYVLSNDNDLVCLTRNEGKIRWLHRFPSYQDEKKRKDPMWGRPGAGRGSADPAVFGRRRYLRLSLHRRAARPRADAGRRLSRAGDRHNSLYVLTDDATLTAYR